MKDGTRVRFCRFFIAWLGTRMNTIGNFIDWKVFPIILHNCGISNHAHICDDVSQNVREECCCQESLAGEKAAPIHPPHFFGRTPPSRNYHTA